MLDKTGTDSLVPLTGCLAQKGEEENGKSIFANQIYVRIESGRI